LFRQKKEAWGGEFLVLQDFGLTDREQGKKLKKI